MNRWIKGAVGTAAAVTLSLMAMTTASATEKHPSKPEYPKTTVEKVDLKTTIPAGAACKDAVNLKVKETVTTTHLSATKSIVKFDPSTVTFYNPKTHKKVVVEGGARQASSSTPVTTLRSPPTGRRC